MKVHGKTIIVTGAGKVDALVNVAGIIQPFVKINDLDMDDVDLVMNVNFFGPLNLVKTFLPELISRPEAHIVNVSSMGSFAPVPGQTLYGVSKAASRVTSSAIAGKMLVDAMEKKANRIYTGSDSKLMGYLTRLAPDFAANLIYKNMKSLLG
jgi:short-subunit dehydrogenase